VQGTFSSSFDDAVSPFSPQVKNRLFSPPYYELELKDKSFAFFFPHDFIFSFIYTEAVHHQ